VGPRAGLDTEARGQILSPLPRIEPRSPGRPARSLTELPRLQVFLKSYRRTLEKDLTITFSQFHCKLYKKVFVIAPIDLKQSTNAALKS
jgi:hypothetical protein